MAKLPSWKPCASAASPPTSAVVEYRWPFACRIWSRSMAPSWLIVPSTGETSAASATGRAPGLSARVKKSLKLA